MAPPPPSEEFPTTSFTGDYARDLRRVLCCGMVGWPIRIPTPMERPLEVELLDGVF